MTDPVLWSWLVNSTPPAIALLCVVIVALWRKIDRKDEQLRLLHERTLETTREQTREVSQAVAHNTSALRELTRAIEYQGRGSVHHYPPPTGAVQRPS